MLTQKYRNLAITSILLHTESYILCLYPYFTTSYPMVQQEYSNLYETKEFIANMDQI